MTKQSPTTDQRQKKKKKIATLFHSATVLPLQKQADCACVSADQQQGWYMHHDFARNKVSLDQA
jgi:hypothetical protein